MGVQVLMSATQSTYVQEEGVYHFHMEHPVPAYLVALVAGDLKPADIGPRWGPSHWVWVLVGKHYVLVQLAIPRSSFPVLPWPSAQPPSASAIPCPGLVPTHPHQSAISCPTLMPPDLSHMSLFTRAPFSPDMSQTK